MCRTKRETTGRHQTSWLLGTTLFKTSILRGRHRLRCPQSREIMSKLLMKPWPMSSSKTKCWGSKLRTWIWTWSSSTKSWRTKASLSSHLTSTFKSSIKGRFTIYHRSYRNKVSKIMYSKYPSKSKILTKVRHLLILSLKWWFRWLWQKIRKTLTPKEVQVSSSSTNRSMSWARKLIQLLRTKIKSPKPR